MTLFNIKQLKLPLALPKLDTNFGLILVYLIFTNKIVLPLLNLNTTFGLKCFYILFKNENYRSLYLPQH